ncbi:OTU domain-containing protein 3-like [Littorina saxatilis]
MAAAPSFVSHGYDIGSSGVVTAQRGMDHLEAEVMRATGCEDVEHVREMLEDCDYDVDATIATLLQTLDLGDGTQEDDTTSLTSQQTADSGIWASNGTGNRIFGGGVSSGGSGSSKGHQKVHFREDSYGGSSGYSSLGSNRGGGARPKLAIPATHVNHHVVTGRQMKEMKKMDKKKRATERHQQRVMGIDPRLQMAHQSSHPEDTFVVKHDITRI